MDGRNQFTNTTFTRPVTQISKSFSRHRRSFLLAFHASLIAPNDTWPVESTTTQNCFPSSTVPQRWMKGVQEKLGETRDSSHESLRIWLRRRLYKRWADSSRTGIVNHDCCKWIDSFTWKYPMNRNCGSSGIGIDPPLVAPSSFISYTHYVVNTHTLTAAWCQRLSEDRITTNLLSKGRGKLRKRLSINTSLRNAIYRNRHR